jgi:uncharacterized protein (DUF2336 family)
MPTELSKEDVSRLLSDRSPDIRAQVAGKIGRQITEGHLGGPELDLARDIARHLANDLAVQVRLSLAVSVKNAKQLPHDIALQLAHDVEQVALPILEFSSVLTDEDLAEIIHDEGPTKTEAIARREKVSQKISAAIIDKADERGVLALLKNRGAEIAEQSYTKVTEIFPRHPAVQASLVKRDRLPITVAEWLVSRVSETLRHYLVIQHDLPRTFVTSIAMQNREQMIINLLDGKVSVSEIEKLARQLRDKRRITPSLLLRALCTGDIIFFEASLSAMAGLPLQNGRLLIHDTGKLGLKSLYDKTGFQQGFYPIIRAALDAVKEEQAVNGLQNRARYRAVVLHRLIAHQQDYNQEDFHYLLDKLGDLVEKNASEPYADQPTH